MMGLEVQKDNEGYISYLSLISPLLIEINHSYFELSVKVPIPTQRSLGKECSLVQ